MPSNEPIGGPETDPTQRAYWAARIEGDLEGLKQQVEGVKAQLAEVTRMKWLPLKVLGGSALAVVFALSAYAVFFILRTDAVEARSRAADAEIRVEVAAASAKQTQDLQSHKQDERDAREELKRTVEKIADVVVYQRPPAVVRSEP